MLLGSDVHGAKVKKVGVRIVAIDLEDFRDEPASRSSFDVDDDVEGIGDVCLDRFGAIYRTHWTNLFAFYGLNLRDFERDQAMFAPPKTQLVPEASESFGDSLLVPMMRQENVLLDKTNLISRLGDTWGSVPIRALQHLDLKNGIYGVIGASDFTMYPLLRPGSIVQIDENQTKPSQAKWKNEHDRPIYFIELREEFICSWCEIRDGTLLAVPYPSPKSEIRKFAHPREAEVIGRVTSVAAMPLAGPQP